MGEATRVVNVRLPVRVHEGLKREAIRRKSSVSGLLAEAAGRIAAEDQCLQSVYAVLGDFIGCVAGDPSDGLSSADVPRVFAEGLERKQARGHL